MEFWFTEQEMLIFDITDGAHKTMQLYNCSRIIGMKPFNKYRMLLFHNKVREFTAVLAWCDMLVFFEYLCKMREIRITQF
jgi:hypothetical protein